MICRGGRVQLTEYNCLAGGRKYPPAKGNALDRVEQFCGVLMTFMLRTHLRPYRLGEYTAVQGEILWNLLINTWRFALGT